MRRAAFDIGLFLAALVSAAYWLAVLALLEGVTTKFDYSGGAEPDDRWMMVNAVGVLVGGTFLYAGLLLLWQRTTRVRVALGALVFAVVSGIYWTGIAFFLLGATAGDTREGEAPDRSMQHIILIVTLIVAPTIFAVAMRYWRSLVRAGVREH